MLILINNVLTKKKDAKISILSPAFMYGHGVFETIRTNNKKGFKIKEHIERLFKSAKQCNLQIKHSKEEIQKMTEKIIKKSSHKNQKIKIIAIQDKTIITSIELKINPELQKKGVKCKTITATRSLADIKSIAYLDSYLAHEKAAAENYYDAILIDEKQEVYEGAYSNIFWFEKDILCTKKDKVLTGITRETILKISPFKIQFKDIKIDELVGKNEIFLSQTTTSILPIIQINKSKIGNGVPGKNTKKLIEMFNNYIR